MVDGWEGFACILYSSMYNCMGSNQGDSDINISLCNLKHCRVEFAMIIRGMSGSSGEGGRQ